MANLAKYPAIKPNIRQFTEGSALGKGLPKVRLRPKVRHFARAGGPAGPEDENPPSF